MSTNFTPRNLIEALESRRAQDKKAVFVLPEKLTEVAQKRVEAFMKVLVASLKETLNKPEELEKIGEQKNNQYVSSLSLLKRANELAVEKAKSETGFELKNQSNLMNVLVLSFNENDLIREMIPLPHQQMTGSFFQDMLDQLDDRAEKVVQATLEKWNNPAFLKTVQAYAHHALLETGHRVKGGFDAGVLWSYLEARPSQENVTEIEKTLLNAARSSFMGNSWEKEGQMVLKDFAGALFPPAPTNKPSLK